MKRVNLKKVVGVLGIAALLLSVGVLSIAMAEKPAQKQELPEQASERAKVTLEKVWEKKFEKKIEKVAGEKGKPSAIMTKHKIFFLDEKGNIRSKQKLHEFPEKWITTFIKTSKNGKYIGISAIYKGEKPHKKSFTVIRNDGKVIWKIDEEVGGFEISSKGKVILDHAGYEVPRAGFEIYNARGKNIKRIKILKHAELGGTWFDIDFSDNGNYFVVAKSWEPEAKPALIFYDENGKELWRRVTKTREILGCVRVSNSGQYIIGVRIEKEKKYMRYINLYDKKGNLLWEYSLGNIGGAKKFRFSADEKYLVASTCENLIYMFETNTGKLLWKYQDPDPEIKAFLSVDISENGDYIVAGADKNEIFSPKYYTQPNPGYVYLFNKNGNILWQKEYPGKKLPVVSISSDGRVVTVILQEREVYQYAVK